MKTNLQALLLRILPDLEETDQLCFEHLQLKKLYYKFSKVAHVYIWTMSWNYGAPCSWGELEMFYKVIITSHSFTLIRFLILYNNRIKVYCKEDLSLFLFLLSRWNRSETLVCSSCSQSSLLSAVNVIFLWTFSRGFCQPSTLFSC